MSTKKKEKKMSKDRKFNAIVYLYINQKYICL